MYVEKILQLYFYKSRCPLTHFFYKNKVYNNIRLKFSQILGLKNFKSRVRGFK